MISYWSIAVNKPGECPRLGNSSRCDRECYTDADCRGDNKCCTAGCGFVCVAPAESESAPSTSAPVYRPEQEGERPVTLVDVPREELDVVQSEGAVATLRCFATGYPLPTVTWRLGAVVVRNEGAENKSNKYYQSLNHYFFVHYRSIPIWVAMY